MIRKGEYVDIKWESDGRPRVLFLTEGATWAFSRIASQVSKAWGDRYQIQTAGFRSLSRDGKNEADLVIALWWGALAHVGRRVRFQRSIVCVYDHFSWKQNPLLFRKTVEGADGVVCANDDFHRILRRDARFSTDKPMWICEDGVDTTMFQPAPFPRVCRLIASWAGNSQAGGGKIKGLDLIREACDQEGVPLMTADREVNPIDHSEIAQKLYHQSSFGLYASAGEGTPNPLLETMACGRPVVITAVGLAPKVIRDGENGVLIQERSVKGIVEAIQRLRSMPLEDAGMLAREAVMPFDWSIKVQEWGKVLEMAGAA